MKELLETIAKSLVDNPDNVSVEVVEKEDSIVLANQRVDEEWQRHYSFGTSCW